MPRTKYLVIFFAIFTLILIAIFVYLTFPKTKSAFSYIPVGRALVIDATKEQTLPTATVATDTTREDMRRALQDKLRGYTPPTEADVTPTVSAPEVVSSEPIVEEEPAPAPTVTTPTLCNEVETGGGTGQSWGAVNITRDGGMRVIESFAKAADGLPLHTLKLSESPVVSHVGCLSPGMIGIALDGRIIETGVPFMASTEGIVGYALDGFGIYGSNEDGTSLSSTDLDECHGHVHPIMWNGEATLMYHYHVTADAPYTLACFRGDPVAQ